MKTLVNKIILLAFLVGGLATVVDAQRVVSGTIYREGKPAAGVTVEMNRGTKAFTSFDGKYEVKGDDKSKWIKFTFLSESIRKDLVEGENNLDILMDGVEPIVSAGSSGQPVMKSQNELVQDDNKDYVETFMLFNDAYKQDDYKSAIGPWRRLFKIYPVSSVNVYIQGAKMYETFIENAKNRKEKEAYIDTLMMIYDQRITHFNEKGYLSGRKGNLWFKYNFPPADDLTDTELINIYKKGYEFVNTSIQEEGVKVEPPLLILFMQSSNSLLGFEAIPKSQMVSNYEKAIDILNKKEAANSNEPDLDNVRNTVENIFGISGAADCDALIGIFTPQFNERKGELDFVKLMLRRLARAGCDKSDLFFAASEQMYKLEPSPEAAYNMARMSMAKNDIQRAKDYYKQAMDQETDQALLSNYYTEYAVFVYSREKNMQEARNYLKKALAADSGNCKANMLLGDIYADAARTFSSDAFEKSTVYWVAVDYYNKARANEECMADATKRINTYSAHFPNNEDTFMLGLKDGESYTVGGWINETTRVRTRQRK